VVGEAGTPLDLQRWAASQNALSWELRAATSLARLMHERGRGDEGRSVLQTTYDRFSEGFETEDLKQARLLLDALS